METTNQKIYCGEGGNIMKQSWAETIKDQVDIVDYISKYDNLTEIGNDEWQGSHNSKHESKGGTCLNVNRSKGLWHCYNCGENGDIISYEMNRTNSTFEQACIAIANAASLNLPISDNVTPEEQEKRHATRLQNEEITEILNAAASFFYSQITPQVREYYNIRGVTDETIEKYKLGYAPKQKGKIYTHLNKIASHTDILLKTGLFGENEDGRLYSQFADRYMIPYWKNTHDVCYFIGRDASDGKTYTDHKTGEVRTVAKYKKLRKTDSPAVEHILYNSHNANADLPILITEGIFDAILAHQEFADLYNIISPVTTRINNSDLDALTDYLIKSKALLRPIIICNDNEDNNAGAKGALSTATKLHERLINAQLPQEETDNPKENKKGYDPIIPDIRIATLRRQPNQDKVDLADYIEAGKTEELIYWIKAARSIETYDQYIQDDPARFFDNRRFVVKELTDELEFEGRFYKADNNSVYQYKSGVYRPVNENTMKLANLKLERRQNPQYARDTLETLKINQYIDYTEFNPTQYLNCKNGVLDLETLTLSPHTPDLLFTTQLPVAFDTKATCPKFDTFLHEIVPEDTVSLIYEMIGYCLVYTNQMHKSFLLEGEGANGKSTLIMAIERLLGTDNIVNMPLQTLEHDPYAAALLNGKLACLYADIPKTPLQKCDVFNMITGGDRIYARHIYGKPFNYKPMTTLIFSCNQVPHSYTHTDGFFRRWIIVKFPNRFDGTRSQDNILAEIATPEELSGILVTSLACIKNVFEAGKFSIPQASDDALEEYKQENEPAKRYLSENVISQEDSEETRTDLYKSYKEWMEESEPSRRVLSDKKFFQIVRETYPDISEDRKWKSKKQVRCFVGIKITSDQQEQDI